MRDDFNLMGKESGFAKMLRTAGELKAGGALAIGIVGLVTAYGLMWWTRGIAVPALAIVAVLFFVLRKPGELRRGEQVALRVWLIIAGLFTVGVFIAVPILRLALLGIACFIAYATMPKKGASL